MENWNEHVLKVRASLDKSSKDEMMKAVREVFTDGAVVDFQNKENLKSLHELVKVFESVFAKAGNKSIDFSKLIKLPSEQMFTELGRIAATSFWDAWNAVSGTNGFGSGIADNIKSETKSIEAEFDALIRKQTQKTQELEKLQEKIRKKEDMEKRLQFDPYSKKSANVDKNFRDTVSSAINEYYGIFDELEDAVSNDKVTEPLLKQWISVANKLTEIKNSVAEMGSANAKKILSQDANFFLDGDYDDAMNYGVDVINDFIDTEAIQDSIDLISGDIKKLNKQIEELTSQHPELITQKEASDVENRLKRIQEAYDRLIVARGKNKGELNQKKLKYMANTLSYKGSGSDVPALPDDATNKQLEQYKAATRKSDDKLHEAFLLYENSIGSDWEERSQYMLRAIAEYESILNNPHANKDILKSYADTYKEFKAQESTEREKLKSLLAMAREYINEKKAIQTSDAGDVDTIHDDSVSRVEAETNAHKENINVIKEETKAQEELNAAKAAMPAQGSLDKEKFAYINTEMGKISSYIEGGYEGVNKTSLREMLESIGGKWDSTIHTHPELIAAPSEEDVQHFVNYLNEFKRNFILAGNQLAEIDFSELTQEQAQQMSDAYRRNVAAVDDEIMDKLTSTPIRDLGVESLNVEAILSKVSEQLMAQFPNLASDIDAYINKFRLTFKQLNIADLSQDNIEKGIDNLVSQNFKSSDMDIKSDIYQITKDLIDEATGIPSMYQEELQKIFIETAKGLSLDPSKIFKLYDANDFFDKLRQGALATKPAVEDLNNSLQETQEMSNGSVKKKDIKSRITQMASINDIPNEQLVQEATNVSRHLGTMYDNGIRDTEEYIALQYKLLRIFEKLEKSYGGVDGSSALNTYQLIERVSDDISKATGHNPMKSSSFEAIGQEDGSSIVSHFGTQMYELHDLNTMVDRILSKSNQLYGPSGNIEAINDVVKETSQLTQQENFDDNSETIAKENGVLEDKLELLRDIAEQYGNNISQKQRDRYEELNQKDMDSGLTPKEDERYWELGEQIEEADSALEEFGETYDKIIVKLANGKNIEILPDDKGLRTLAKIDEEYGESYSGVEIEDVEFVRKEIQARQENVDAINQEVAAQEKLNNVGKQSPVVQDNSDIHNTNAKSIMSEAEAYEYLHDKIVKSLEANNDTFADYEEMMASSGGESLDAYRKNRDIYQRARNLVEEGYIGLDTEWMDGTSFADVKAAQAEAEQQRLEKERIEAEKLALQQEAEAKIQAETAEKMALQNELDAAKEQVKITQDYEQIAYNRLHEAESKLLEQGDYIHSLEEQVANSQAVDGDALFAAEQRANEAEVKTAQLENSLAETLKLVGQQSSIDSEELKNVLSAITYNVKVVQDEDGTNNKVAIDETSFEATLNKVFANILNPQTQQNDSEQKQERWALESTLQSVKGVLDNIQTNASKIGTTKASNIDTITGTALDKRLSAIKSVLESIDKKIAKGGVINTKGAAKQSSVQPVESAVKEQAARSNMMKSLINDYKTMGKLAAQFASDGDLTTKAMLENLKEEIARKRKSLKITMDENNSLREKYSIAFDAEKRLLDAEKAQRAISDQNREAENTWKKQVKDAQRATGINAATSAANAGDQTVLRAIGTEGISQGIEDKAKELSNQIKTLRALRDEIDKKGSKASEEDRNNLSKQITKVKELKTEVDGYLKIHEKYSGKGVTDLGDASSFGAVGTNQYWDNITAAIKNASSGKVIIKGLNAEAGELTGVTRIAANTFAQWSAAVDPLTGRLSILRTGIKKTETIIEQITRKTREIFTYFSGSSMIFKVFNELKRGVRYVREIDLALTELKKVTDATEETYDKFLDTAAKTAEKVGSTIQKVISSTADWARLGYSMKEAAQFAETTQILMNVSEFTDVSQATDTLISAVQAFGYTAETSMDVVDLLNTIGK